MKWAYMWWPKERTKWSGIQMPFENWNFCKPDLFPAFEYWTSLVFRSILSQINRQFWGCFKMTLQLPSESRTPEYWIVWVSGIQMVKSHDLADHSNTKHFGPWTGFFQSGFQTIIWILDHSTTGHKFTIWIPDLSGIQMVTVFESPLYLVLKY